MGFDTKANFGYLVAHEENSYIEVFVVWHTKSCLAIKASEHHTGPYMGVYPIKGGLSEVCIPEHIVDFISERKKEWTIGVKCGGVDICAR